VCGIAGFSGCPDEVRLAAMTGLLAHRGPDGEGFYVSPSHAMNFGHRRLSIIDLAGGIQPMANEDGSVVVVFNGEIYNYRELAAELAPRHAFHSRSDTEVLVHLYEEAGERMVERLNGMFSFALWDERRRRLLLVRDRLGVKPLYWTEVAGRLAFASEMKALLCWPEMARDIDPAALAHYLSLRYVPEPATIFAGIRALPAGHYLLWEPGRAPQVKPYWSLDFSRVTESREEELVDRLEELLLDAIRLRLRSDVPVGAYLSGGLDSSLVVAMAKQRFGADLNTFSLGYADQPADKNDLDYARLMARRLGTAHHEVIMQAGDLVRRLPEIVRHLDQPFSGVLSTYFLTELVSRHVKVVLTGDGADDLFASYGHHRLVWPLCALEAARRAGSNDPYRTADLSPLSDRAELVRRFDGLPLAAVRANFGAFSMEEKRALLNTPQGAPLLAYDAAALLAKTVEASTATDDLNRMLDLDIRTSLPGEVLFFCDRLSMAHGVEARSPFLDYRIAEFSATVAGRLKINGSTLKYLLRRLAARYLPSEILQRPKEGFVQPNHVWLRTACDDLLDDVLSPAALSKTGLFDPSFVRRIVAEHKHGTKDHAFRIWTLVMFQMWHRTYIDEPQWPKLSSFDASARTTRPFRQATGLRAVAT
jgi:asparagine synthase (glutamine-hydrolysing)